MKTPIAFMLAVCFSLLVTARQAAAVVVTVPPGLNVGDQYRLMFVTSTTISATSSNISDYNTHTHSAATAVTALNALATTWNAVASTGAIDARDNTFSNYTTDTGYPIYRLDGVRVANDYADLWDNSLLAPVNITELGTSSAFLTWTGTNGFGQKDQFGLYLGNPTGVEVGVTNATDGYWIGGGFSTTVSDLKPLYAMSEVLTVRVPEPVSLQIATLGALTILLRRRKRNV
jgi:hypothetical protein